MTENYNGIYGVHAALRKFGLASILNALSTACHEQAFYHRHDCARLTGKQAEAAYAIWSAAGQAIAGLAVSPEIQATEKATVPA